MKRKLRTAAALLAAGLACTAAKLPSVPADAAATVVIAPTDTYAINNGIFEGWGTSLCWWANRVGYSDSLAQQAADVFYGDNGLRLNIARFNIGGGDDPSHDHITRTDSNMPGYTKYQNGAVTFDWTADANQRNVLLRCAEAAGDDMIVEMFSNSPPYYMTKSGCSTGNRDANQNNLRDDSYTAFAEYLAEVCKHYEQDWGIKVQSVEPVNEPYTNFWGAFSAKQEGCHFDIGNSESKIILELQKAMAARGMSDVILCGTDETSIDTQIEAYNALSNDAKKAISRIDTHTYGGSQRGQLKNVALNAGKNLWMSEVDGNGTAGTNAGEMAAGLWLAQRITTDCNELNASAWILWQVIDKHICAAGWNGKKDSGMPDISTGFWGTAVADHDRDTIILTKKYYSFGQYTRYIRPGMIMLNASGNTMAAYVKKKEQVVLVAYNTSGSASDLTFDLTQFDAVGSKAQAIRTSNSENWANAGTPTVSGGRLNVSLAPNSVTTYIIDGVKGSTDLGTALAPVSVTGSDPWNNDTKYSCEKAFDGSTSTYFDGVGGGWVQADFGDVFDITGLGYSPRSNYEARCADGVFFVSEDGVEWKPVYTIKGKPSFGMHYVRLQDGPVSGRYVRYQVPDGKPDNGYNTDSTYCCNIAEITVFGAPVGTVQIPKIEISADRVTGSESWGGMSNGPVNAFDGNTATFFDGTGDGWVQADLGGAYRIEQIGFCPRSGYEYRTVDSFFEISMDGINWTKIYTVSGVPSFGMHYISDFAGDMTARYLRYAVPSGAPKNSSNKDSVYCCNIAEIAVYGSAVSAAVRGDVDANGVLGISDAVMLCKYLLADGTVTDWRSGDLDGNGTLNAVDLTLLKRLLMSNV